MILLRALFREKLLQKLYFYHISRKIAGKKLDFEVCVGEGVYNGSYAHLYIIQYEMIEYTNQP